MELVWEHNQGTVERESLVLNCIRRLHCWHFLFAPTSSRKLKRRELILSFRQSLESSWLWEFAQLIEVRAEAEVHIYTRPKHNSCNASNN